MHASDCNYTLGGTHCTCKADDAAFTWALADSGVRLRFHKSMLFRHYHPDSLLPELAERMAMLDAQET